MDDCPMAPRNGAINWSVKRRSAVSRKRMATTVKDTKKKSHFCTFKHVRVRQTQSVLIGGKIFKVVVR